MYSNFGLSTNLNNSTSNENNDNSTYYLNYITVIKQSSVSNCSLNDHLSFNYGEKTPLSYIKSKNNDLVLTFNYDKSKTDLIYNKIKYSIIGVTISFGLIIIHNYTLDPNAESKILNLIINYTPTPNTVSNDTLNNFLNNLLKNIEEPTIISKQDYDNNINNIQTTINNNNDIVTNYLGGSIYLNNLLNVIVSQPYYSYTTNHNIIPTPPFYKDLHISSSNKQTYIVIHNDKLQISLQILPLLQKISRFLIDDGTQFKKNPQDLSIEKMYSRMEYQDITICKNNEGIQFLDQQQEISDNNLYMDCNPIFNGDGDEDDTDNKLPDNNNMFDKNSNNYILNNNTAITLLLILIFIIIFIIIYLCIQFISTASTFISNSGGPKNK